MNPVTDPALLAILNGDGPAQSGPPMGPPPKPPAAPSAVELERLRIAQQAEARQAASQQATQDLNERKFDYQQQQDGAKVGANGATSADPKVQAKLANLEALEGQINRVQQLFNEGQDENTIPGLGSLWEYLPTQANTQFDSASAGLAEQGLAAFRVPGVGAQSDTELRQFVEANKPSSWSNDSSNLERLRQLRARVEATRKAMGLPPPQWTGIDEPAPGEYGSANPIPPALTPAPPEYEAATGDTRSMVDPETSGLIDRMIRSGAPIGAIDGMLRSRGFDPIAPAAYDEWRTFLADNPNYKGPTAEATRTEGVNAAEQAITEYGDNPVGAYFSGAGQFLSGNTLDNLSANPEDSRLAMSVAAEQNPGATFAGQFSGGVLASLMGEAGLARAGMASGFGRGLIADTAMGAANGAGAADGGNRLAGAVSGGVSAAAGNVGGTMAMKGAGSVISPTGGRLSDLYAAGVRPTPGQRFADSGLLGRMVNSTEEALQSVPIVGAAISGARQEARDQFQVGAFNQALSEIGEELPKGMKPGTDPHAYAQAAFNRVYDEARSGMRLVADEQLSNDLGSLAPDINTLGPQAQDKLKAIMANSVNSKLRDGVLEGGAYKAAVSDLGKHIARLGRSAMGEDQALADVLISIRNALDGAARRNSDPDAVALLDAADAGYAKLVRIEEAAARRGGEAGTFSPNNFDSAVQKTSGGVRSKAYLRGDAQMQDYANQGKALSDRMPNSGTTDRAMTAGSIATVGAGVYEPTILAALGAIGAAYAPGVRQVTKGAMAPRGPRAKAIARQLQKRARLVGKVGGATGAVAALETAPAQ